MPSSNNPLKEFIQHTYTLPSERNQDMNNVMAQYDKVARNEARQYAHGARLEMVEDTLNINSTKAAAEPFRRTRATSKKHNGRYNVDEDTILPDDVTENAKKKPARAESFQCQRKPNSPRRYRRYPHTVPSDKDREAILSNHRTQCLSKAIQSNTVDIVGQFRNYETGAESWLPSWLTLRERKDILDHKPTDRKTQMRKFLLLLTVKDFETMRLWLQAESQLDPQTLRDIWKTYEEFNDSSLRQALCFFCKLKTTVDVRRVTDHLYSAFIVDREIYTKAVNSDSPTGKHTALWESIADQCKQHPISQVVINALTIALNDAVVEATGEDETVCRDLIEHLRHNDTMTMSELMSCDCDRSCSRLLYPVSLVKGLSLASVYMPPPTGRRETHFPSPRSSSSSGSESSMPTPLSSVTTEDSIIELDNTNKHQGRNPKYAIADTNHAMQALLDQRHSQRQKRYRRMNVRRAQDDNTTMKLLCEPHTPSTQNVSTLKKAYEVVQRNTSTRSDISQTNMYMYENPPMSRGNTHNIPNIQRRLEGGVPYSHVVYGTNVYVNSTHIKMRTHDTQHSTSGTQSDSP